MSIPRKPITKLGFDSLTNRFQNSLSCDVDENSNKPDFRELDLGSPVSPLRIHPAGSGLTTTTSSSSSSSGSFSGRNPRNPVTKNSDSGGNSHSGELSGSVESSPTGGSRGTKPGHRRSFSGGVSTHPSIYSGGCSVNSPVANVLPAGNICPTGKVLKTGMATRSSRTDVLGSGSGHYGHGSIMRGGAAATAAKPCGGGETRMTGEPGKRQISETDDEELKRAGNEMYRRRNFIEALNLYDKAIVLSPGNASYRCNRAAALMALKRLPEAVRECDEALRLDPEYLRAHRRLGSLFLR